MSLEWWKAFFEIGGVVLLLLTFAFAGGALLVNNRLNAIQAKELDDFKFKFEGEQQKTAIAQKEAAEAKQLAGRFEGDIAIANQRVAEANKATEDERLARVELQKLVEWRTITSEQQKEIAARLKRFPKVRIAFTVNAGDPEGFAFGTQIASVAINAGWNIVAFAPITNLGSFQTGVTITTTGDENTLHASDALTEELNRLNFSAKRSPEIDTRPTDPLKQPLLYVFVNLKPQAISNAVSRDIAATQK